MNPTRAIQVLKVEPEDANNLSALRRAFHAQALKYHPDKNISPTGSSPHNGNGEAAVASACAKQFQNVHEAYQMLVDEVAVSTNALLSSSPNNLNENELGGLGGLFGHLDDFFNARKRNFESLERRGVDRSRRRNNAVSMGLKKQIEEEQQHKLQQQQLKELKKQQQQQQKQQQQHDQQQQLKQQPKREVTTHLKQTSTPPPPPPQLNERVDVDLSHDEEEKMSGCQRENYYTRTCGQHPPVHKLFRNSVSPKSRISEASVGSGHTNSDFSSTRMPMPSHVDLSSPSSACSNTSSSPSVESAWHLDDKHTGPFGHTTERHVGPFGPVEKHVGHAAAPFGRHPEQLVGLFGPAYEHADPFGHATRLMDPFRRADNKHTASFGPAEGLQHYATMGKPQGQSITTTSASYSYESSNGNGGQSGWSCQWSSTSSTSTTTPATSTSAAAMGLTRSATLRDW